MSSPPPVPFHAGRGISFPIEKAQSRAALPPTALGFVYRFGGISGPYTTLCKPSVFSISSITPSVATIMMVASAAMVGSK